MSIRSLVAVAVVVWSVAALVAVSLGLPVLLTVMGVHVEAGLIVNALVALGTFSAAGAAVWIATSDRRDRKRERDAADHAQARLVLVDVVPLPIGDLTVTVRNFGDRSILDVTCERLEAEDFPSARFIPQLRWLNVVAPIHDNPNGDVLGVRPADEPTREFMQGRLALVQQGSDPRPTVPLDTPFAATIRFTDANDNRWETTFELRGRRASVAAGVETVGSMRRVSLTRV